MAYKNKSGHACYAHWANRSRACWLVARYSTIFLINSIRKNKNTKYNGGNSALNYIVLLLELLIRYLNGR